MANKGFWSDSSDRLRAFREITNRKVFIGDTDTIPGLYAPLNREGFEALNEIKGRQDKPYLILISDIQKIEKWAYFSEQKNVRDLMEQLWPGPLTILLKAREATPDFMKGREGTIAFRIPNHKNLLEFLNMIDGVFSTSANLSGEPFPKNVEAVDPVIIKQVDLIMKEEMGLSMPSTIIDCSTDVCKIVREGSILRDVLKKFLID